MSNIVWNSNDLSLNYVGVCFVLIIMSPLFLSSVEALNFNISPPLIVAGVPDKTKTKEFQVRLCHFFEI